MMTFPRFISKWLSLFLCVLSTAMASAQTYQVGHISATFTDIDRSGRSVPCEIYYPADVSGDNMPFSAALTGKAPIVSFGHGFVMTYDAYANIRNALVANGYIIAFPTTEGSLSPVHAEFGKDLAFVLRQVSLLGTVGASVLFNKVSPSSCVMGHSMGGGAAYLAMTYDTSINAVVTFAAAETTPSAIAATSSIAAPALSFAGENDCVSSPSTNQQPMHSALISSCKHYISIKGGSHCQMAGISVTCNLGESTCTPAPSITRSAQHASINKYLIPWLNYTLKGICADGSAFETALATDGAVTFSKNCTLCTISSIQEAEGNNGIPVYPNPSTDNIIFELPYSYTYAINIYSTTGIKVLETYGNGKTVLSTGKLSSGVYIYSIAAYATPATRGVIVVKR
jgi:hypothetical protein